MAFLINIFMSNYTITANGRTYTPKFAWLPTRTDQRELVWLVYYYISPDRNGNGRILSRFDFLKEMS